ncbi:hypothetical protein [Fimbriiglobus ruber]|uniref:Uncharacterized protein n=1 Tax=Fimbriiglobus ruber TaxID=1908690 RepID=A0A225D3M7_9BACT|nr:hypothetical protein [Fimbriiglobus ruber]OWK35563.1 hypothetical protein FRUB_08126 [Fimbriiglobus ruber]
MFLKEAKRVARLFASKSDYQLLGETEFELRDRVHDLADPSLQTALDARIKGGYRRSTMTCPHCHESSRCKGFKSRRLVSLFFGSMATLSP